MEGAVDESPVGTTRRRWHAHASWSRPLAGIAVAYVWLWHCTSVHLVAGVRIRQPDSSGDASGSFSAAPTLSAPVDEDAVCSTCPLCEEKSPLEYDWDILRRVEAQKELSREATKPESSLYYFYNTAAELSAPLRLSPKTGVLYFSLLNSPKLGGMGYGPLFPQGLEKKFLLYQLGIRWPAEHSFANCASKSACIELQLLHVAEDMTQSWVSFGFSPAVEPSKPSLLAQLTQLDPSTGMRTRPESLEPILTENEVIPIGKLDLEALFQAAVDPEEDAVPLTLHAKNSVGINASDMNSTEDFRLGMNYSLKEQVLGSNATTSLAGAGSEDATSSTSSGENERDPDKIVKFVTYEDEANKIRWFVRANYAFPMKAVVFEKIKSFIASKKTDGNGRHAVASPEAYKFAVKMNVAGSGTGSSAAAFGSSQEPEGGRSFSGSAAAAAAASFLQFRPPASSQPRTSSMSVPASSPQPPPAKPHCLPAMLIRAISARPLLSEVGRSSVVSPKMAKIQAIFGRIEAENATSNAGASAAAEDAADEHQDGAAAAAAAGGSAADGADFEKDGDNAPSADGAAQAAATPPPEPLDITIDCTTCGPMGIAYRHPNIVARSKTNRTAEDLAEHCKLVQAAQAVVEEKKKELLSVGVERARCRNLIDNRIFEPYEAYAGCRHEIRRIQEDFDAANKELLVAQRDKERTKVEKAGAIARAQEILEASEEKLQKKAPGAAGPSMVSALGDGGAGAAAGAASGAAPKPPLEAGIMPPEAEDGSEQESAGTTADTGGMLGGLFGGGEPPPAANTTYHPTDEPLVCPELHLRPKRTAMGCALEDLDPFSSSPAMACAGDVSGNARFEFGNPEVVGE